MDEIKQAFEKYMLHNPYGRINKEEEIACYIDFKAGFEAADLLPTEKDCPECGGKGWFIYEPEPGEPSERSDCMKTDCKNGKIQLYYTPEDVLRITGKSVRDNALVWMKPDIIGLEFIFERYKHKKGVKGYITYIVQTNQGAPDPDYRQES